MSELIIGTGVERGYRRLLLVTVSVTALAVGFSDLPALASGALVPSTDTPLIWIELGGDFEQIGGKTDRWMPPARGVLSGSAFDIRKDAKGSFGMDGKISYAPEDSSWIIWVSGRYGRSQRHEDFHTQTRDHSSNFAADYTTTSRHSENHTVLDFMVGKDVGLGRLSRSGHALIGAGVRIAQFRLDSEEFVSSNPRFGGVTLYYETAKISRRTSAAGPLISFDASLPIVAVTDATLALDWGLNASLLFGRQKASLQLRSYVNSGATYAPPPQRRSHGGTVPNIGGFAGISYRFFDAKVSVGYKADFFFGAIDGGMDAAKKENRGFFGPYASISVGLGD